MLFEELLELGLIRPVGIIALNGEVREIYAHDKSSDLFVYVEDEGVGFLVSELAASDDMVTLEDVTAVTSHVEANIGKGCIGAIQLKSGNYIEFLSDGIGGCVWKYSNADKEYATDFFLEVIMEDYD